MEILTYKKVYQLVGDDASGTNECITKSAAVEIAQAHRKDITSNLSQYLNNEYIDIFSVEDKPDLSNFSFTNKGYNPQASGNTYTTSVSSRDIDGNTIPYNATSDVDWITNIVINGTEIRFTVSPNIGDQRTGHITGSNATGKSDTITIIQEAKEADIDCTYILVATCDSVPTVTINGTSITRYTTSGNNYTFQYTVRVRTESEAPQSVGFTINGGGAGESYNDGTISLLPSSWSLNEGLSKQFTVNYSRVKTTKTWDNTSGTISRNGSVNVAINASDTIEHPTIDYTISDTHVSGQSFSHSKDGMQFTSAASSVNCTGTISVQYNGLKATSIVTYAEEFQDDTEHRWIDVSPTQFTFPADGGSVDITGTYGLTGTLGTRKEIGSISDAITVDANTTPSSRSGSKTYYYNNDQSQTPTAEVSWTQPNKEEEFPEEWTYVFEYNISDTNGGSSTDTSWSRQYYANGQEIKHDDDFILDSITSYRTKTGTFGTVKKENVQYSGEIGRPSGYNYSDQQITESGKLIQDGSNKELQWSYTQEANVKVWGISADPTSLHFEEAGGTQSVSVTTWYTWQTNDNNNQKFEETTIEEEITAEANTSTQQKEWTETITKNDKSVTIDCTQDGKRVVLTAKYHLYVGLDANNINDNTVSLVWQSDQYGESSKKTVYVNAYKEFINESNEVVSTETVEYSITSYASQSKFSVNKNNTLVDFYPLEENTDYSSSKEVSFRVSIPGQKNKFCTISLIQERKGVQLISGDAVMFTYNWDKGKDLDQATYINLNSKSSSENNYAGYSGNIHGDYVNILYFAGDNTGTGNEYSFIDFESMAKYLNEHGDDQSLIDGKTVLQSLTNENGVISVQCDLYTNWWGIKESQNIMLTYGIYNKDSEGANININDKQFVLTGYTKTTENTEYALCYAAGSRNVFYNNGPRENYTLSAKFTYYLNSGVFAFETNKNDVAKWQNGFEWEVEDVNPSFSDLQFINDGENINFAVSLDAINNSKYIDENDTLKFSVYFSKNPSGDILSKPFRTTVNKMPYKASFSIPLSDVVKKIDFGENDSVEIYPYIYFDGIGKAISEDTMILIKPRNKSFNNSVLTIQKQST